jgi:hypothetical protein
MFLIDPQNQILAKLKINEIQENLFQCDMIDDYLSDEIRGAFLQYEEIIDRQMFSFLDEI